jgi:site-specific DNA-methyltransferase (adenine-specific)
VRGGFGFVETSKITSNQELIPKHKIFISKAYNAGDNYPHQIINLPFYGEPNSACTETYLVIGPFDSKKEAINALSYMRTKLFRLLVLLKKISQNTTSSTYQFVPIQDFSEEWTDEKLYKKYGLTKDEIAFIESMIRPMDVTQAEEIE